VVSIVSVFMLTGDRDLLADLDPALLGDRERGDLDRLRGDLDLLRGEAVRLDTLAFFLSFLNKLSTFLFFRLGLLSFRILDISF